MAIGATTMVPGGTRQIMLATSRDAILLQKRGFKLRVDEVAGNIFLSLEARQGT